MRYLSILIASLLIGGCVSHDRTEHWIGYYQYPGVEDRFSIYMEFSIRNGMVSGLATDSSGLADIKGTFVAGHYELLLHPMNQGGSVEQDVWFRGVRSRDTIVGEWEHVVGVSGHWAASITDLEAESALRLERLPCDEVGFEVQGFEDRDPHTKN